MRASIQRPHNPENPTSPFGPPCVAYQKSQQERVNQHSLRLRRISLVRRLIFWRHSCNRRFGGHRQAAYGRQSTKYFQLTRTSIVNQYCQLGTLAMAGQALAAFSAGLLGTPRPHAHQPSSTLSLPDDLLLHIARYIHPNDIACSLRPACKHTAALFPRAPHTTTIRLSHPVPHHTFHRRWCSRAATHSLPRQQRTALCCLTARSGSLPNLSALLSRSSLPLEPSVFNSAAAAGHIHICRFLKRKGCPHDKGDLMEAAISSGQLAMCTWLCTEMGCRPRRTDIVTATTAGHRHVAEWLLQAGGCTRHAAAAAAAAARAGHVPLYTWLRGQLQAQERYFVCGLHLLDLAQGCPLGVLRTAYDSFVAAGGGRPPEECVVRQLPSYAALSRTADWRDKVVWAEDVAGAPRLENACEQVRWLPVGCKQ